MPGLHRMRTEVPRPAAARHRRGLRHALGVDVRAHRDRAGAARRASSPATSCRVGWRGIPYDMPGRPRAGERDREAQAEGRDDMLDPGVRRSVPADLLRDGQHLDVPGRPDTRWISVAINQCCTTEDFLLLGRADRRRGRGERPARRGARARRDDAPVLPVPGAAEPRELEGARQHPAPRVATRPISACCGCCRRATTRA